MKIIESKSYFDLKRFIKAWGPGSTKDENDYNYKDDSNYEETPEEKQFDQKSDRIIDSILGHFVSLENQVNETNPVYSKSPGYSKNVIKRLNKVIENLTYYVKLCNNLIQTHPNTNHLGGMQATHSHLSDQLQEISMSYRSPVFSPYLSKIQGLINQIPH